MIASVTDNIGVRIGDHVEIVNSNLRPVADSAIALILPIILFIISYIVGGTYLPHVASVPLALVLSALPVLYIRRKERRGDYKLAITRIVKRRNPGQTAGAETGDSAARGESTRGPLPEAIQIRNAANRTATDPAPGERSGRRSGH